MVYPQIAVKKKLEGKCYLRYVISEKGDVTSVKVTKGVPSCPECDQEAVRLIKKMPKWKPCKNNGVAVNCYFNTVISFQLN